FGRNVVDQPLQAVDLELQHFALHDRLEVDTGRDPIHEIVDDIRHGFLQLIRQHTAQVPGDIAAQQGSDDAVPAEPLVEEGFDFPIDQSLHLRVDLRALQGVAYVVVREQPVLHRLPNLFRQILLPAGYQSLDAQAEQVPGMARPEQHLHGDVV